MPYLTKTPEKGRGRIPNKWSPKTDRQESMSHKIIEAQLLNKPMEENDIFRQPVALGSRLSSL